MDLTAAIEAAAKATYEEHDLKRTQEAWEALTKADPMVCALYRESVLPAITAALPHIEAAILRRTAQELRAERFNLPASFVERRAQRIETDLL